MFHCSFVAYCFFLLLLSFSFFFFFNDTATTEIYTLSLHDALPISLHHDARLPVVEADAGGQHPSRDRHRQVEGDRKSTRLNSSHSQISYAVFCLKKKKKKNEQQPTTQKKTQLQAMYPNPREPNHPK